MKGLYKMAVDVGRGSDVSGTFVADSEDVKRLIGTEVYFGEICGKHSEVAFVIEEEHIQLVTTDPAVVDLGDDVCSGHNPFGYAHCCVRCDDLDCEDRDDPDNDALATPKVDCVRRDAQPCP